MVAFHESAQLYGNKDRGILMNLVGRILTLLILLLSVCFLVIALMVGATHRNWKEIASNNQKAAESAKRLLDSARSKSTEIEKLLNMERVARTMQLAQLESQLSDARGQYEDKESQLREQTVVAQEALDRLKAAEKRLTEQDTEVAALKGQNKTLIDDISAQRQSVVNLTSQVFSLQGELESLEQLKMDLSEQLALKTKVMTKHGLADDDLVDQIPPSVDGVVIRVKDDYIAISLGTDDGLRNGHTFDIYRGDRYIGKAVVTRAEYNMSAARLDKDFLQAPVAEGDHVTTKF